MVETPSEQEFVSRASNLVPLLKANAAWTEENRKLHPESLEALTDAGFFRMRIPKRYGGHEVGLRTLSETVTELARGDGSTAWTASVWTISTWIACLFPDEVQDEIFSTPDVRVCGILSPTATATPTAGGYIVNGKWTFNSGAQQSHWNTNSAILLDPDADGPEPIMTAIPLKDLEIIDDWHTSGLRGTGSVSTVAQDVFVPAERVLKMGPVLHQKYSSVKNADSPIFQAPLLPTACATVSAIAVGLAKAAKENFFERLPGRKITYTDYTNQSEAPLTHLQVAEATIKVDESSFHALRAADLVDAKTASGEEWTLEERARVRLDLGATCQRAKEAVDILATASGGSSAYSSVPMQRIERDIRVVNLHAVMHPNTNLELYGRIACGLGPNTHYL
ncbi:acyl-CoA dehydrogenase family protein [Amycolatopsis xylanica]|uniref:acyl-CoA dehydrogenase family protein n=1 Tax=Amycolatopsis xylanica TaxID=589385 RepID=UPI001C40AF44|nr:acyl-CoA dehydrogenase family protein [Amycolatopsis xylanica]